MKEIWKDIKGFENRYQISNLGKIKSLKYHGYDGVHYIMQGFISKDGYPSVSLAINKYPHTHKIHRLMALNFIDNPNNLETVNHKDGNKKNNHIDNLEWASRKDQMVHAVKIGLMDASIEKIKKFSFKEAQKIRKEYRNFTMKELAKKWDCGYGTINSLLNNRTYKASDILIINRSTFSSQ